MWEICIDLDGNRQQFAYALEIISSVLDVQKLSHTNVTKAANALRVSGAVQSLSTRVHNEYHACVSGKHFPHRCRQA